METPLPRGEHEEFRRTVNAEIESLNKRVTSLETDNKKLDALTVSVQQLTDNIEHMRQIQQDESNRIKELDALTLPIQQLTDSMERVRQAQTDINNRLKELEGRDGAMWRKVVGYAVTAIISVIIGYIFSQIGF